MNKSLLEKMPQLLQKVCELKDFMKNKNFNALYVDFFTSIRLNTYESNDGAKGMFLLLKRDYLKRKNDYLTKLLTYCGDDRDLNEVIEKNEDKFIEMYKDRCKFLQEKLEFFTYKKLSSKYNVKKTPCFNFTINDFDFLLNRNLSIEVKSDKFWFTGNISLELLREQDITNCKDYIANAGSILKTKADIWQEYYYCLNNKKLNFFTEVYDVIRLQEQTIKKINYAYYKYIKGKNANN